MYQYDMEPVPEPPTPLLLTVGFVAFLLSRKRMPCPWNAPSHFLTCQSNERKNVANSHFLLMAGSLVTHTDSDR